MRRSRLLLLLALLSFALVQHGEAAKYRPTISTPTRIQDALYGISELRSSVELVECGGWDPDSQARIIHMANTVGCKVKVFCHDNTGPCQGITGGFARKKEPDGTLPVDLCLPASGTPEAPHGVLDGTKFVDYTMIHELTHAKQFCPLPPGADLIPPGGTVEERAAKCCNVEMEAYNAACSAMQDDGMFNIPYNGIMLNANSCAEYGASFVSCSGFTQALGHPACGPNTFPPEFGKAYSEAIFNAANFPGMMCKDALTSPSPRVKSLLDDIKAMSTAQEGQEYIVEGNVPLPLVSPDVPGRTNNPATALNLASTGVAPRGSFEFPESARGYTSSCDIRLAKYFDSDLQKLGLHVGVDADGNELQPGEVEINPKGLCLILDKATPKLCKQLYDRLKQLSAMAPRPVKKCEDKHCDGNPDPDCKNCPPVSIGKTYCFDFTEECTGQTCRTPWEPRFIDQWPQQCTFNPFPQCGLKDNGIKIHVMSSFYRHYAGPLLYTPGITVSDVTGKQWKLRAECYEYYKEKDPMTTIGTKRQCEIVVANDKDGGIENFQRNPASPEWKDGEYLPGNSNKQKERYKAEPPLQDPPRAARDIPPGWAGDDKTNVSLISDDIQEIQQYFDDPNDITGFMDAMIPVKLQASKTVNDLARTDTFHDASLPNADVKIGFRQWWETQQRELLKIVREPMVKLILPARFLTGLSQDDPLFRISRRVLSRSTGTVELTLRAGADELGTVLESLRRAYFLPIREVRIPIVLPLASENELRNRKREWEAWKLVNPAIAAQADPHIAKIDEYLETLEKARLLRLAITQYLTELYPLQDRVRDHFGKWYVKNSEKLLEISKDSDRRKTIMKMWRKVTKVMLQTDACQMQWCSNQRYSQPIYSLLDGWLRPTTLETPINLLEIPDYSLDFSSLGLPDEEVAIPVLWPVMARIRIPLPPTYDNAEPESADKDPILTPIPSPESFGGLQLPSIGTLEELPTIPTLPEQPWDDIQLRMAQIRHMLDGTPINGQLGIDGGVNEAQEDGEPAEFPSENGPNLPVISWDPLDPGSAGMRGEYCAFTPSLLVPPDPPDNPDPDDEHGDKRKILHVENDLRERIARLFSRWMPERKEDYAGRVARLLSQFDSLDNIPNCKEDIVCAKLPIEKFFGLTIELLVPDINQDFTDLYNAMRTFSVPASEELNPYVNESVDDIKRFFPPLTIPIPFDLLIPKPTST